MILRWCIDGRSSISLMLFDVNILVKRYTSTAFGFEKSIGANLTNNLWNLPWGKLATISSDRQELREEIGTLFAQTIADSRRPINEVDLWSWGSFVGALYKSALAGALLTGMVPAAKDLRWRLLSIRIDGPEYISNVARIPHLLARQQLLTDALDDVCMLLEVEYPLGSEVYRDQNGSTFIVPDVPNLLEIADDQGTTLRTRIIQAFAKGVDGELFPAVTLEQDSWWGQDPNWSRNSPSATNDKLPNIKDMLAEQVIAQADAQALELFWQDKDGNWELCPVCRLRPKREKEETCVTCEQRRGSRVANWQENPHHTIWIDEIADHNDRVALIIGKFGLDDWLSGDLVQTMLVRAEKNNPSACKPKNPSPARLRRVWETCQRYWTETVERENLAKHEYGKGTKDAALRRIRLLLIPNKKNAWKENVPYDGAVNGKAISLLWRGDAKHFITISNLQLSGGVKRGQTIVLSDPDEQRRQISLIVEEVRKVLNGTGEYAPYLPLLASPDQFLALVPASDALMIADKIRDEYERQFGKVQNRLPLFVGIIFFQGKMPLMAAMDAARRMLKTQLGSERWTVEGVNLQSGECVLKIKRDGQEMEMRVSTTMGDGSEDKWYPYFFVEGFADGTPDNRKHRFQYNGRWLVHVKDLRLGDVVSVNPSRFTYLFLESTAQRFTFDSQKDVMLLDELPRLREMWKAICKSPEMSGTKLQAIHALFESKRQDWKLGEPTFEHPIADQAFYHLVETTLIRDKVQGVAVKDVLNGCFRRCLDLHLHILKSHVSDEKKKEAQHEPTTI
jgi:hypothetical protein